MLVEIFSLFCETLRALHKVVKRIHGQGDSGLCRSQKEFKHLIDDQLSVIFELINQIAKEVPLGEQTLNITAVLLSHFVDVSSDHIP